MPPVVAPLTVPKHLGKHSPKPTTLYLSNWKTLSETDQVENAMFLRLSIDAHKKQSFFVFQGLHCL